MRGKVGVLDLVARFRVRLLTLFNTKVFLVKIITIITSTQVRNMSGYVTVYTDLSPSSAPAAVSSSVSSPSSSASSRVLGDNLRFLNFCFFFSNSSSDGNCELLAVASVVAYI